MLALIETETGQRFALDATQTPPNLSASPADYTRVDFYMEQFTDCVAALPEVTYFVADGYYAKEKVFRTMTGQDKSHHAPPQ